MAQVVKLFIQFIFLSMEESSHFPSWWYILQQAAVSLNESEWMGLTTASFLSKHEIQVQGHKERLCGCTIKN